MATDNYERTIQESYALPGNYADAQTRTYSTSPITYAMPISQDASMNPIPLRHKYPIVSASESIGETMYNRLSQAQSHPRQLSYDSPEIPALEPIPFGEFLANSFGD